MGSVAPTPGRSAQDGHGELPRSTGTNATPSYAVIERGSTIPGRRAFMRRLAERVRERRAALGLKQAQLAAAVGWSQAAVSRLEHDANLNVPFLHVDGIVHALDLQEYTLPMPPTRPADERASAHDDTTRFVAACRNMPPEVRARVARLVERMAREQAVDVRQPSSSLIDAAEEVLSHTAALCTSLRRNGAALERTYRSTVTAQRDLAEVLKRARLSPLWTSLPAARDAVR